MTNDYKENSLHYLVGDLQQQTGINAPTFNIQEIDNDLYTQLQTIFPNALSFRYKAYIQASNNKHNDLNISILGIAIDGSTGAIILLDEENNIIQTITNWADGSTMGAIQCMNVDENGNYYAVEYDADNLTYRIVELNNIALKLENESKYSAIVINSYSITNPNTIYSINGIQRNENKSKYFIVYQTVSNYYIYGKELDVNSNTWTTYTSTAIWSGYIYNWFPCINQSFNIYWNNNGDLQFQIATFDNNQLKILSKGDTTTMTSTSVFSLSLPGYNNNQADFVFYSNAVGYLALTYADNGETVNRYLLYKINLMNNSSNKIIDTSVDYLGENVCYVFKGGDSIFYAQLTSQDGTEDNIELELSLIDNSNAYGETIGTFGVSGPPFYMCYPSVYKNYNQYKVHLQAQNTLFTIQFNWNENEYNGEEFISYGSLVPQKASIIDDNNTEIYNRNLFTLTSYLNSYTATLNVPHELLNGITFDRTNLYSKNNNLMIQNNLTTTKNKFEELNINFNQTFDIEDNQNNKNINASANLVKYMLNESTDGIITKAKINYNDNTNRIISVSVCDSNTYDAKLEFAVYVDKPIKNVELLSDDGTTSYHTIKLDTLELNKYYLVKQKVKIE